jgi:very-short-patch-repair endonuclease
VDSWDRAALNAFDPDALPRILTRQDADRLGLSPAAVAHQVRTGRWRRVLPRTYLTAGTLTWPDRQNAALRYAGDGALLSGAAALADDGLRCVSRPDRLLVLMPYERSVRSTSWVRIRRATHLPARALLPGPARVPPARAVTDIALESRRLDDVRTLVAQAVRARLCTVEELAAELRVAARRGSAHLRQAIDEVGAGAWSAPEAQAAVLLRRAGLTPFEQNWTIHLPGGGVVIADFCWPHLRAVLEIDSYEHHSLPVDAERTDTKHIALETLGYSVIHRTPRYLIRQPDAFVAGVRAWLDARAAHLSR